jgi:hypothetical protein
MTYSGGSERVFVKARGDERDGCGQRGETDRQHADERQRLAESGARRPPQRAR